MIRNSHQCRSTKTTVRLSPANVTTIETLSVNRSLSLTPQAQLLQSLQQPHRSIAQAAHIIHDVIYSYTLSSHNPSVSTNRLSIVHQGQSFKRPIIRPSYPTFVLLCPPLNITLVPTKHLPFQTHPTHRYPPHDLKTLPSQPISQILPSIKPPHTKTQKRNSSYPKT